MGGYSKLLTWDFRHYCLFAAQVSLGVCLIGGGIIAEAGYSQSQNTANPTPTSTAAQNSQAPTQRPLLKLGTRGASVTELQGILSLLGYYDGALNGLYDEKTATAVAKFQKAANLTADGVVGSDTWSQLLPPAPPVVPVASTSPQPATNSATNTSPSADSFPMPAGTKPASSSSQPPNTPVNSAARSNPATGSDRSQAANSETAAFPILRLGMKGSAVEGLQKRLRALGFLSGSADGVFGPETQAAVKSAQRKLKLEPDGVVGSSTWMAILQ